MKLLCLPLLIVLVFSSTSFLLLVAPAGVILLLVAISGVELRFWWRGIWVLRWLLLFSLALHLLFSPGRTLFGTSWLSYDGLLHGLLVDTQVMLVVLCSLLVTLTTLPRQLAAAFSRLLRPLERLRFPVDETAALLMMMFHFFPLLCSETRLAINELRTSDTSFRYGSLVACIELLRQLIPPLVFRLIEQADRLAIGLATHDPSIEALVQLPAIPPLKGGQVLLTSTAGGVLCLVYWALS
ncbi:MAG: hypothetical protein K0A93_07215 [Desulfuromonadaceae bacterium]|nr:hypothetical protein [Desulfuromonadaceae bacterium]